MIHGQTAPGSLMGANLLMSKAPCMRSCRAEQSRWDRSPVLWRDIRSGSIGRYCSIDFNDPPLSDLPRALDLLEERVDSGEMAEWQPERATAAVLRGMLAE